MDVLHQATFRGNSLDIIKFTFRSEEEWASEANRQQYNWLFETYTAFA